MKNTRFGDALAYSRRDAFRLTSLAAAGGMPVVAQGESSDEGEPALAPLNRFPRMVQEYFVERVGALDQVRLEHLAALRTKADAEAYVRTVRKKIRQAFGPMPEKTSLRPRITGVLERDTYNVEKVIFESRPGFLVAANLYLPTGRPLPLPGVVGACGHTANGKSGEAYQAFAQGLARLGYVVLLYDPIGQGERLQYVDEALKPRHGIGTREHNYAGNQQYLVDECFPFWRSWDGIRALDYLMTRKEVDQRHLGITGNSGGGTLTTWLCGLDQRWTMAAPSCFVTEMRRNLENELPQDSEQCPPRMLSLGLDHEDFLAALAPKPVIILGKEKDFFDVRGTEAAYGRLKRLYELLEAPENVALFVGPTSHGYSQENREAMYKWFNRCTGVSDATSEPRLVMEDEEDLRCTPAGQVAGLGSRPILAFTREKAAELRERRSRLDTPALRKSVAGVLRLTGREEVEAGDYRILRPRRNRGYPTEHATTYMVSTEPGVHAIVYRLSNEQWLSRPPRDQERAVLYVSHLSSDAELREEALLRQVIEDEHDSDIYTCDVRGIGDSRPDTCDENSFFHIYGSDYFYSSISIMLDQPALGRRTLDVLRVVAWLREAGYSEVHMVGKGWGALPAAFAALLSSLVVQVTLKNALTSYTEVAEAGDYDWPLALLIPGVLRHFDLPDVYAGLASKRLRSIEPWGANPDPG